MRNVTVPGVDRITNEMIKAEKTTFVRLNMARGTSTRFMEERIDMAYGIVGIGEESLFFQYPAKYLE